MQRSEIAKREADIHDVPLDLVVADTQGSIGYMLQQALDNSLRRVGMNHTVATIITQMRVDPEDPAFDNPDKPVGGFMTEAEAEKAVAKGWQVMEDAGRGWRRVVASPKPAGGQRNQRCTGAGAGGLYCDRLWRRRRAGRAQRGRQPSGRGGCDR